MKTRKGQVLSPGWHRYPIQVLENQMAQVLEGCAQQGTRVPDQGPRCDQVLIQASWGGTLCGDHGEGGSRGTSRPKIGGR